MFGFKENAVFNDLRVSFVVIFAGAVVFKVYVCHICFKRCAVNGEGGGVENVKSAVHKFCLNVSNFCRSVSGCCRTESGKFYGTGCDSACPVLSNVCFINVTFGVYDLFSKVFVVRRPVDSGRNDERIGASGESAAVVRYVGNFCCFTSVRCAHGVSVLADKFATFTNEQVCCFLFAGFIIPATGKLNVHLDGRADGFCVKVEGGVAGDNFRIGVCADVTHFGFACAELACCDHFIEFQTCGNACEETTFVNGSECVDKVRKIFGVSSRSGCVCKQNFGSFFCSFQHICFVTERVSENDVATCVDKVHGFLIASIVLRDIGFDDDLVVAKTEFALDFFHRRDEVFVVRAVFVMQAKHTDFNVRIVVRFAVVFLTCGKTDCECCNHRYNKENCKNFFLHYETLHIFCHMAFFNLVFSESDAVVRHTFDNRKAFDADALLSQLVPAFLEALFDGNRAPDKSRARLPDQCDKPAQRLAVSKKIVDDKHAVGRIQKFLFNHYRVYVAVGITFDFRRIDVL